MRTFCRLWCHVRSVIGASQDLSAPWWTRVKLPRSGLRERFAGAKGIYQHKSIIGQDASRVKTGLLTFGAEQATRAPYKSAIRYICACTVRADIVQLPNRSLAKESVLPRGTSALSL